MITTIASDQRDIAKLERNLSITVDLAPLIHPERRNKLKGIRVPASRSIRRAILLIPPKCPLKQPADAYPIRRSHLWSKTFHVTEISRIEPVHHLRQPARPAARIIHSPARLAKRRMQIHREIRKPHRQRWIW